jgi:ribosomal protein L20
MNKCQPDSVHSLNSHWIISSYWIQMFSPPFPWCCRYRAECFVWDYQNLKMNKGKIFKLAKGFRGRAKNCIRIARERVEKALQYSYRDRRNKKRDMRSLWIERINAGTRLHGVCIIYFRGSFCSHVSFTVTLKQTILTKHQLCSSHTSRISCQSFESFQI